jgi:hypothetical protein
MHRPIAALALLVGCSSEPNTIVLVVERETSVADSTAPDTTTLDTAVADTAPQDTGTPIADTGTAVEDTYVCRPMHYTEACAVGPDAGLLATTCGTVPDGCGGWVKCPECSASRRCAVSPTDVVGGRCSCVYQSGKLCTASGISSTFYECRVDDVPLDPRAEFDRQSNLSVSWWCIPRATDAGM